MKSIHILLVEDNEGDIMLTTEALEESDISHKISIAKDGKIAIDFLNKKEQYQNAESPDLILLDINLPKKNGLEVLQYIKSSEQLKQIPVIMLTTSSSKTDIIECYKHHGNGYLTKPFDVSELIQAVAKIENFGPIL
ncbi:MAG: response regulator [Ferruginibacter sp.]